MKICLNGKIMPAAEPALLVSSRGYRYGDGLFETMLVKNGRIRLGQLHFQRLFDGITLLRYRVPGLLTPHQLEDEILHLCKLNQCLSLARVRLSVTPGNGGLYDEDQALQYVIECWPLDPAIMGLNDNGLVIGICPDVRKSCDPYSALKSASYQLYSIAARYAKEKKLNDCLILNTRDTIADSTIANLFLVKQGTIITPPLSDGGVKGVMRSYLVKELTTAGYSLEERSADTNLLAAADEVFLTNAVRGIRWVRQAEKATYRNTFTAEIYNRFITTIPD